MQYDYFLYSGSSLEVSCTIKSLDVPSPNPNELYVQNSHFNLYKYISDERWLEGTPPNVRLGPMRPPEDDDVFLQL